MIYSLTDNACENCGRKNAGICLPAAKKFIDRQRLMIRWGLTAIGFVGINFFTLAQIPLDTSHHVPIEKNLSANWKKELWSNKKKVYKGNELLTIGMPCGGIAAGQLYVRGDGTLANWWIANNAYNTGCGINAFTHFPTALGPWEVGYQTFRPVSYIDQGFFITIDQAGRKRTVRLDQGGFDDISFVGEYPIAKINYASKAAPLPLKIDEEVFSPFIPLNAKESATPGTILKFTVTNTSAKPLTASLKGWLQNLVCLEIADEINASSRNRVVKRNGITSVIMDLTEQNSVPEQHSVIKMFDNFETGYGQWKITGNAFGNKPADGKIGDQSKVVGFSGDKLVNSYLNNDEATGKMISLSFPITNNYIFFKIAGGSHQNTTCINLVVNGKIVRTASGDNTETLENRFWDVRELQGQNAYFEIVDNQTGSWGHICIDDIGFSNQPLTKKKYFPYAHPYFGNLALSVLSGNVDADADFNGLQDDQPADSSKKNAGDKLVGAIGTTVYLKPGETKDITFLLTWYFPNRPSYYYNSDATDVIAAENWSKALPTIGATILGNMYSNWYSSSLDVAYWLQKELPRLSKETHLFHDAYYESTSLPYWLVQRLMMPVSALATETCQWWANNKFWAWEGVGSCVGTCTHVWNYEQALAHLFPGLERNIREKTDFETSFQENGGILARNGWGGVLIDGQAGAILKAYREHLNSKDNLFLFRNWDKIKRATQFIISEDENEDGLIEKRQANTYDIAFYGANTYTGSLYLASLKAAVKMANIMMDTAFSERCGKILLAGEQNTIKRLWNGEYFIQQVNIIEHPKFQYATGCLSDQLFGQTWAHLTGMGYIYPREDVKKALQSIWRYNWAPDVAAQNNIHPPERTFASAGEPGLLICTWPRDRHMEQNGVRYRDEVWTGIEYQIATNMIYEDMIGEGMSIVKGIYERYRPEKHNPWNEVECGDHYARALASWGVLLALENFYYNGPEKIIGFMPKVQQDDFEGFFTAAQAWGIIRQKRTRVMQANTIQVKYGQLSLQEMHIEAVHKPSVVRIYTREGELPCTFRWLSGRLTICFSEIQLNAGQEIRAVIDR